MNRVLLNTVPLDGGKVIIKGGSGGGGGSTPGGGGTTLVSPKAVNFRDYDGTVLYAYTKEEFLALRDLPPLPTREGLICQEWNWDYEDAIDYVSEYGFLEVGATYITDDGKTRIYIHIEQNKPRSVILYFHQSKKDGVIVNWGDGSESQTVSSSGTNYISHTFKDSGDYCVTFEVMDGCSFSLKNSFNSSIIGSTHQENGYYLRSYIRGIEFGHGVTSIANYSFNENDSIAKIVIPKGVTSIGNNAFYGCNISSLVIPQGVKSISENSLPRVENISFPKSLETIGGNALQNSFKLHAVIIPPNVTNIPESCCSRCFDASPIIVPKGVSDFGTSAFSYCQTIQSFVIPQGVTTLTRTFQNCVRLTSIIIPSSVTQIGEYTFYNSSGLKLIDFTSHSSIPTLKNYNAFSGIASACKIVVPDELYDSWISATNWSNSNVASKIVKASEFNG